MTEKVRHKFCVSKERMYDLLLAPLVTEKTSVNGALGQYAFYVRLDAVKAEIKRAVEEVFGVDVLKVNTLIVQGKTKKFKGRIGFRSDRKKAIVTLKSGQTLDVTMGK